MRKRSDLSRQTRAVSRKRLRAKVSDDQLAAYNRNKPIPITKLRSIVRENEEKVGTFRMQRVRAHQIQQRAGPNEHQEIERPEAVFIKREELDELPEIEKLGDLEEIEEGVEEEEEAIKMPVAVRIKQELKELDELEELEELNDLEEIWGGVEEEEEEEEEAIKMPVAVCIKQELKELEELNDLEEIWGGEEEEEIKMPVAVCIKQELDELEEVKKLNDLQEIREGVEEGEGIVMPETVFIKREELDDLEEIRQGIEEGEVCLFPFSEANDAPNSTQERCELTGQLSLGHNLKLQMQAKFAALNAKGGLGSNPQGRYQCYYCEERLLTRNALGLHMRKHTGRRPFQCELCKIRFGKRDTLKQHMLVHSTYKKNVCKICKKGYAKKSYLNKHIKNAHSCRHG